MGRIASERQINKFSGLLVVKMIRQKIRLTNQLTHQSTTPTNKRRQWQTRAEHRRLMSGSPLMKRLDIHKDIPVAITKQTLSLLVGFSSLDLAADKLFPVDPKAFTGAPKKSLLLEAQSRPALIIKPRLILVSLTDDLNWYTTSNQHGHIFIQNLNWIIRQINVTPWQILYFTTNCISIDLMFQENFHTDTQVGTAWTIEMIADKEEWSELPMGVTTATCTRSGTSVIRRSSVQPCAWVGATNNWPQPYAFVNSKAGTPRLFVVKK